MKALHVPREITIPSLSVFPCFCYSLSSSLSLSFTLRVFFFNNLSPLVDESARGMKMNRVRLNRGRVASYVFEYFGNWYFELNHARSFIFHAGVRWIEKKKKRKKFLPFSSRIFSIDFSTSRFDRFIVNRIPSLLRTPIERICYPLQLVSNALTMASRVAVPILLLNRCKRSRRFHNNLPSLVTTLQAN